MKREEMDRIIQDTMRRTVAAQEPSAGVRDSLLSKAAVHNIQSEPVVGSSIPPLVTGLRETQPVTRAVRLPELEAEFVDLFGSAQQRLVSVWMLAANNRY